LDYPHASASGLRIRAADERAERSEPSPNSGPADAAVAAPNSAPDAGKPVKSRSAKQFWLKQLHSWHWISAAISLIGMFGFAVTGFTLNHAATIGAKPQVVSREADLPKSALGLLERHSGKGPLPEQVAAQVADLVGIDTHGLAAEWSAGEVYVAIPGPGSDAWVSIDRGDGGITAERTDRGWISFFNDLHKGRNSGTAWFWFIDVFAAACVVFTFTGLLLLQLHARRRPLTWPMVGFGTAVPLIIVLFFLHM
jgi:hypothetical protein